MEFFLHIYIYIYIYIYICNIVIMIMSEMMVKQRADERRLQALVANSMDSIGRWF
jgi:hypothetical protein